MGLPNYTVGRGTMTATRESPFSLLNKKIINYSYIFSRDIDIRDFAKSFVAQKHGKMGKNLLTQLEPAILTQPKPEYFGPNKKQANPQSARFFLANPTQSN